MIQASLSLLLWWFLATPAPRDVPVSLAGSAESMERQHRVAKESGYEFLRRPADVSRAVNGGDLVPVAASEALALKYPRESVARPEVRHFLESFAGEMNVSCGEQLVVTSLTRPVTRQPRNAHRLSVHPAGMAIDLRVPRSSRCRKWLESSLLELERGEVLDVTREWSPAHYHVALFPNRYLAHIGLDGPRRAEVVAQRSDRSLPMTPPITSLSPR
jgi:hypothetical protein